jgi:hypothetical protein
MSLYRLEPSLEKAITARCWRPGILGFGGLEIDTAASTPGLTPPGYMLPPLRGWNRFASWLAGMGGGVPRRGMRM